MRLFTVIVLQLFFVVAAQAASVTTDSNHYAPGSTAVVTVSGGPANTLDWVGLYAVGATNYEYQDWRYLNGQLTPPSQGQSSATISLVVPQDEGQYDVRFLLDNGYDTIAISQSFQVSSSPINPVTDIGNKAIVAMSGGDYPDPHAALRDIGSWCGTPSATNPCLIEVMPGDYNVGVSIALGDYVHLRGSGRDVTILTGGSTGDVVVAAGNTSVRDLTIFVEGRTRANAITVTGTNVWVDDVTLRSPPVQTPFDLIDRHGLHLLEGATVTAQSLVVDGFGTPVVVDGGELSLRGFKSANSPAGISVGGGGTADIAEANIRRIPVGLEVGGTGVVAHGIGTRVRVRNSVVGSAAAFNEGSLRLTNSETGGLSDGSPSCCGNSPGRVDVYYSQVSIAPTIPLGPQIRCFFSHNGSVPVGENCRP
jgi:hypothetical protein